MGPRLARRSFRGGLGRLYGRREARGTRHGPLVKRAAEEEGGSRACSSYGPYFKTTIFRLDVNEPAFICAQ